MPGVQAMSKFFVQAALAASTFVTVAAVHSEANAQGRYGGYPPQYCLRTYDGAMDCAYLDRRQCQTAARGTGGDCAINPRFVGYPDPRAPQWKRYR